MRYLTETRLVNISIDLWTGDKFEKYDLADIDEEIGCCYKMVSHFGEDCYTTTDAELNQRIKYWEDKCSEAAEGYDHDEYESDDDYISGDECNDGALTLTDYARERGCFWQVTVKEEQLD